MTDVLVDDAVRRRITHDGLDELLFVEAGAGTGKTKQLVDRVVSLIVARGVPMREIAAVTFTEAAASELRSRIREALERTVHDPVTDPEACARCEVALADLDGAAIGTVHSFAQRILSEHPIEAGLPPNVEVLDEVESLLEFGHRWREQVDRMFSRVELQPVITLARLLDVRVDDPKQPSLREVAAVFSDNWDRLDTLVAEPVVEPQVDRAAASAAIAGLEGVLAQCATIPDDKLAERLLGFADEIRGVAAALAFGSDRALLRVVVRKTKSTKWTHMGAGKADNWGGKDQKKAVAEQVAAAEATLTAIRDEAADAVLRALAGEVARFTVASAEERLREGRLEFHDLLVFARRLLRTSPDARQALHGRYRRLLIDEFQDTDPIQIELATLIAASVTDADPVPAWDAVAVDPERLFFVGDPKQSIYRFRRADIALFLAARDRFAGESVRLQTNFRTVAPVLEWVNEIFGALMADESPGRSPRYDALTPHRGAGAADHRVVLLGGPHAKAEKLRAGPLRELEADTVAGAVADILTRPDEWPVEQDGEWRPARPEDITILVPTRTSLAMLMDALRARDIEFRAETGTLVYDTQEIRDLLAVLRAVAYGTDGVSLVAALRSAIFACGDDDLVTYVHAGGRWDLEAQRPDLGSDHPVLAALAFIDELRAARWWTSPSALIEWIVRERNVLMLGLAQPRPRDTWRRIRFLIDQARMFEGSQSADLVAFVEWAELQRSEMARVHEPLLPEADDHAVRIMTIHGAKGLEFPITVVSGLTTRTGRGRNRFRVYWDGDGVGLSARKDVATAGFDRMADLEAEMDDEEKKRLLYVACTRARDHLLVATHHLEDVPSFAQMLWEHSQSAPDTCRRARPEPAPGPPISVPRPVTSAPEAMVTERAEWVARREALLAAGARPRTVSATAIRRAVADGAGREPAARDDETGIDPLAEGETSGTDVVVPAWRRGAGATAFGRAVHAVLQDADLVKADAVDALAATTAVIEGIPEAVADVATWARAILAAPVLVEAAALSGSGNAFREMYVAAPVGGQVIEGYIDLLLRTPDGLVIVDYKTDPVTSPEALDAKVEEYRIQLAAYAAALEISTGDTVHSGVLVFAGGDGAVERRIPRSELGVDEVREHLATV
ncbi:MAG: UvrD-helicase domain-containing protein [Acidimicrobiia bacterium]|nr:UvrD-helicase domain-containing protein [Acidimicrobiia bacterium]